MTALLQIRKIGMAVLILVGLGMSPVLGFQNQANPVFGVIQPFQPEVSSQTPDTDEPFMEKSFPVDGAGLLRVFTPSGNIRVVGVKDTNAVVIRLYIRRGYALWSGSKSLENFRITNMKRGNEITASVESRNRESNLWGGSDMSFNYVIRAPKEFSAEMQSLGGDIEVENLTGRHLVKTNGGNLKMKRMQGDIKGFTAGGHIQLADCRGVMKAQTYGGNIQMKNLQGEIRTYSSGGNIEGKELGGSLVAHTNGGNIHAEMSYVDQGLQLESSAGNVHARVPEDQGYEVILKGLSVDFDESYSFVGQRTNRYVSGQIGDGGPVLNLTTNVGTVTLTLSGTATQRKRDQKESRQVEFDLDFDWD